MLNFRLRCETVRGYAIPAPAKSGAGRENPINTEATQTPEASFFVSDHYAHLISGLARTVSMVALVGLSSDRPGSFVSGILTPANVTTPLERENSGGDSLHTKEAATWLLPLPPNRLLSGLSPLFAVIALVSKQQFTISTLYQSRKHAAFLLVSMSLSLSGAFLKEVRHA